MSLPNTPTWNLADFSGAALGGLLSLGTGDLTITPTASPYFTYNDSYTILSARSADGVLAVLDFNAAIPSRYTVEMVVRFPEMPHNFADLETRRVGITVADDAGRGVSIYFSSTGVAISRVDDFGSVTALPETNDTTEEIGTAFKTIRVAVDSSLGRAYVMIGNSEGVTPEVRYVIPVEASASLIDVFKVFTKGLPAQPSRIELRALRLASGILIPDLPPTADAGPDRVAPVGQSVRFDGRSSFDIEGAPLTYSWIAFDAPFGSAYAADNSSGFTVDDGDGDGFTSLLSFTPMSLPEWVAVGDILRIQSGRYVISGFDNASGLITTSETIPDNLGGTPFRVIDQSMLVGADTETPYLVPDVQGIYRVGLVVNDGESDSEMAEVLASIVGARAPMGIEPDVSVMWKALGDEWNAIDKKGVFEEAWKGVTQILGGKLLEVWQHHYNYSLRDAQRTFQRKWQAFKTLIVETSPSTVTMSPRYGSVGATYAFEYGTPAVTGGTLSFTYHDSATTTSTVDVVLTGNTPDQIVSDVNAALSSLGIVAYTYGVRRDSPLYRFGFGGTSTDDGDGDGFTDTLSFTPGGIPSWVTDGSVLLVGSERFVVATADVAGGSLTVYGELPDDIDATIPIVVYRSCRIGFRANRGFFIESTAASVLLGISEDYNHLSGLNGAVATDRTYYAGDGVDFSLTGIMPGDLLVLNNGQSFTVDRFLTADDDPLPCQRLLISEVLPLDASAEWTVPSLVTSTDVDYEFSGSYPGDRVKTEVYDLLNNNTLDLTGYVVAQKGRKVGATLDQFNGVWGDAFEIRLLGIKRCKAIPIPEDIVSIPRLQEIIPANLSPYLWKENEHYVLEPFYRDLGGAPIPQIQFRDSVFADPDIEPPDVFWAELVVFSNDRNIEDLFGLLAGFLRDDASSFGRDFNYASGVAGLMYAQQRGPSIAAVKGGAQILLGQPFAEAAGTIEEIRNDFSPTTGRMLVRDLPTTVPSEIVRTYYYRKDPLDLTATSGLALAGDLDRPWQVGDAIPQFSPIGAGVDIVDLYNDRKWFVPYVKSGLMGEIEKFHRFIVRFNLDLVTLSNLSLLFSFITRVKPTYTHPMLVGLRQVTDDIDMIDDLGMGAIMNLFDSPCGAPQAYKYDDYRGDGTIWSGFDDGSTFFDGIVDCPTDIISFVLTMTWAGGVITYDTLFFEDTEVVDVDGVHTGVPGTSFTPAYDMNLPAGTYSVTVTIKGGGVVLP